MDLSPKIVFKNSIFLPSALFLIVVSPQPPAFYMSCWGQNKPPFYKRPDGFGHIKSTTR
jgi:hypothetical protein